MTVQILGVFLGILFLALMRIHYKNIKLSKQLKDAQASSNLVLLSIIGLNQMLLDKELLTDADFVEFSLTGKIQKKNNDSKTIV